jgi:type II secretory pathway pseudopilin PulG
MGWQSMDRSSIGGFTILEIFIAILIISISAIVIGFFTRSSVDNYSAAQMSETAYTVGEEKLSDLKAAPFPESGNDLYIVENDTFSRAWTVTPNSTPGNVVVNVSWVRMGRERTIKVYGVLK